MLLITGIILLFVSLVLAWLLVMVRYLEVPFLVRIFQDDDKLLKAHIDYILMSILLLIFYLLAGQPEQWSGLALVTGATLNPFLFLVLSVNPDIKKTAMSPYGIISTLSFILTTTGFVAVSLPLLELVS